MDHAQMAARNRTAWNTAPYQAWTARYGPPDVAASRILADPRRIARRVLSHLPDPAETRIANPLGSHGSVAVALAVLGAQVTVFDIASGNARYARELATAAGVGIDYVVGDFLECAPAHSERYSAACMELGITHYFHSLDAFALTLHGILSPGSTLVLAEFHPLVKKALAIGGGEARLSGDYFTHEVEAAATPYDAFTGANVPECTVRRWTLGEIVTAFAQADFRIAKLAEHPHPECTALPGEFTLVATRA